MGLLMTARPAGACAALTRLEGALVWPRPERGTKLPSVGGRHTNQPRGLQG